MALSVGTRLGPYEILSALGAGGMGEVYKARDTKLNREVAIKVLPDLFAGDPERLARFEREAQVLASLNHPNIAHIHGLEDTNGIRALVMELVDGPTLADIIGSGLMAQGSGGSSQPKPTALSREPSRGLPIAEALAIARQIAEALESAHEQGIVHRDLKPANIKVRDDGTVKVLDFGLAKLVDIGPGEAGGAGRTGEAAGLSASPTLSLNATMAGVILGTAAYMAPEQARGKAVDKRADIWAFGAVLFEMLAGRPPFPGDDISHILARVIDRDPDWSALPPTLSPALVTFLRRCLVKDPRQRIRDIGDVRLALTGAFDAELAVVPQTLPAPRPPLWRRVAVLTAVAVGVGVLVGAAVWLAMRPAASRVSRLSMPTSGPATIALDGNVHDLAITPDGSHVVYVGNNGTQLFVRALDALEPVAIVTGRIRLPFVSPDGQWVGFVESNSTLKRVAISGGPATTLASLDGATRGATWLPDDTIVLATTNPATGLQRVSANGGTPTVVTRPDRTRGEAEHNWPEALPGGRAVLFTITAQSGGLDSDQIAVLDLGTNMSTIVVRGGSDAHYAASGHLVYTAGGMLRAVPFDLARLAVRGPAVPVVPRLVTTNLGAGDFDIATDGTLVYVDAPGRGAGTARTLVWVDRKGKEEPIAAQPRTYVYPRLSPDGTRVAIYTLDQERDIWIWDLQRATLRQFTFDPGQDAFPVWTPDSRRIVFNSQRAGGIANMWWQAADGTGVAERLTTSSNAQFPTGTSPAGTQPVQLVFNEVTPTMGRDLMRLALDGSRSVISLLPTAFDERNGVVSPDGHWLAYESEDNSGRTEVSARPFPNVQSGLWPVSTSGGTRPLWSSTGKELFFFGADGALMRVSVEATATTLNVGTPAKFLEPGYFAGAAASLGRTYDVSADGQRFLMIKTPVGEGTAAPPSVIVVQHFDEELKRLVPTGK